VPLLFMCYQCPCAMQAQCRPWSPRPFAVHCMHSTSCSSIFPVAWYAGHNAGRDAYNQILLLIKFSPPYLVCRPYRTSRRCAERRRWRQAEEEADALDRQREMREVGPEGRRATGRGCEQGVGFLFGGGGGRTRQLPTQAGSFAGSQLVACWIDCLVHSRYPCAA
jgi:hypothetical protein